METGYIGAFWFLVVSACVVPLMMGVGFFLRPRSRMQTADKGIAYECGEKPVGSAWIKFNIRFYVVAIVFIIFDVEMAAIFPPATIFRNAVIGAEGALPAALVFGEIFLFIALLLAGLMYCWVRGDLEWVKGVAQGNPLKK